MLMDDAATPSYEVVAGWLAGHRLAVTDLQVVATLGTPEAAELMVEAGAGAAFLPRAIAARGLALGCIKEVTVRAMPLERTIYLARQLRRSPGPAERAFWDFAFDPANETLRRPAF
jgi:DNA-binding transcriptional LysR family regulator